MQETYEKAIAQVFKDEGGYTNEASDPGGPTNWGITIHDAQTYWKADATAEDVRDMPKSVAEDIYNKHYALPIKYDDLPAGVDYAVLDYGINSGISRSVKVLQEIVNVPQDGVVGPITLQAVAAADQKETIQKIYAERLAFLQGLHTWPTYGKGWTRRVTDGEKLALSMITSQTQTQGKTMNPIMSTLSTLFGSGQIGGWVRALVASGLTYAGTKYGIKYLADPGLTAEIATGVSTVLVGLWSSLSKTNATSTPAVTS